MNTPLLKKFKIQMPQKKKSFVAFLKKFDKKFIKGISKMVDEASVETWNEVDCLQCANCCKVMTPTFTDEDLKRISSYFQMSEQDFFEKWLVIDEDNGDRVNKIQPCQFLDLKTNMCTIYEIRPEDCRWFPHFQNRPFGDYNHVHEQNIEYCPATFTLVSKLKEKIEKEYEW